MTAFVILAAGRGSRMGRVGSTLHKALVPLNCKAILTHIIERAPSNARIIVCTGYRGAQVASYVRLAHPHRDVYTVDVDDWNRPGAGPGASLMKARQVLSEYEDLIFTSCDTLWEPDESLWKGDASWSAVAHIPVGTLPDRWCRMEVDSDGVKVRRILDKTPKGPHDAPVYTGLSRIIAPDLRSFWDGVKNGELREGEMQVTGGLQWLVGQDKLQARVIDWTDVGDEKAYARAVAQTTGYDWTKTEEATYVLPEQHRVLKWFANDQTRNDRITRGQLLGQSTPEFTGSGGNFISYRYVEGVTAYQQAEYYHSLMSDVVEWARADIWTPQSKAARGVTEDACDEFYRLKTYDRLARLRPALFAVATDAVQRVEWRRITVGCEPVTFHGDFNFGNIIVKPDGTFVGIDWRQDFAGHIDWGDKRYDLAKLLGGCVVHWDNARRGDFRPWEEGEHHVEQLERVLGGIPPDVWIICALSLINSAPLHAEPLDEILVARAIKILETHT